jgi:hypothetical protein
MDFQRESQEHKQAIMDELAWYVASVERAEEGDDEHSPVYEYGLEFSKENTNHRTEVTTYRLLIGYGGPTCGLFADHDGERWTNPVWFFSWSDYASEPLTGDEADTVLTFLEQHYYVEGEQ